MLMNFRKHLAPEGTGLDACSSAAWFDGFRVPGTGTRNPLSSDEAPVTKPRTWLATVGWRRHGLIDPANAPPAVAAGSSIW